MGDSDIHLLQRAVARLQLSKASTENTLSDHKKELDKLKNTTTDNTKRIGEGAHYMLWYRIRDPRDAEHYRPPGNGGDPVGGGGEGGNVGDEVATKRRKGQVSGLGGS